MFTLGLITGIVIAVLLIQVIDKAIKHFYVL